MRTPRPASLLTKGGSKIVAGVVEMVMQVCSSPCGNGCVSKHHLIIAAAGKTYPRSLSSWRLDEGMLWDVEILTSVVSASLEQEFLLTSWQTVPKNRLDSPRTWVYAMQTRTTGFHDRIDGSCWLRPEERGTWEMSSLVSCSVNCDRSAAAYDETGLWRISFCVAGQLVCVSV